MSTSAFVSPIVTHPRLKTSDAASIRDFLRAYDKYVHEVTERANQLSVGDEEVIRPASLKYCMDQDWLESMIESEFIPGAADYETVTENCLRKYLEGKAQESRHVATVESIDKIVEKDLRTEMTDTDARSRMETLFATYLSLLRRNGLSWVIKDNPKVAVRHVCAAIRPNMLKKRVESDMRFSYAHLRKDFKAFRKHVIRLADAFQLVDNGKPTGGVGENENKRPVQQSKNSRAGSSAQTSNPKSEASLGDSSANKTSTQTPICLFGPCKSRGIRHRLKDCQECPTDQKKVLLDAYFEERKQKSDVTPAMSTRSKTKAEPKTVGRLNKNANKIADARKSNYLQQSEPTSLESPEMKIRLEDGTEFIDAVGRADDGSDESIVSRRLAEKAALDGIGKIAKIEPLVLQVALMKGDKAQTFRFSRTWTPPRTVLRLSTGPLALTNLKFFVADDELAAEEILIGLPVLRHLGVDTKTMLERDRERLDGADCSALKSSKNGGSVSRLMIARHNRIVNTPKEDEIPGEQGLSGSKLEDRRPRVDYFESKEEEDPFPDESLLDPIDVAQQDEVMKEIQAMLSRASEEGLQGELLTRLKTLVLKNTDVFRVGFSSGPPAQFKPMKIELVPNAKPVRVRLRNYTQEQRLFLSETVKKLVDCGMAYENPTSPWASAPLLVAKPGPAKFRFTTDLRPVNRFTVAYQYPMPNTEQELVKVSGSKCFANVDFCQTYWQLALDPESQATQSFITPDGVYSPTRVMHGTTNAVMYLQSSIASNLPDPIRHHILLWLDDVLQHAATPEKLLDVLEGFFAFCVKFNLKLHPAKCTLYTREVRWCGRIISAEGIRFDPRRISGIKEMDTPTKGGQLQQFVCAMQWMRSGIPMFSTIIRPLSELLEAVYQLAGKRTKRAVSTISLDKIWTTEHNNAFEQCKQALINQITLVHRNTALRLCVYTDASDLNWSGLVTQVPHEDLPLDHEHQRHEPMAFLSGAFAGAQLRWSTLEKEGYAIMATVDRMHWVLSNPDGFDIFTDHNNLVFLFDPLSVVPDLAQTTLRKVLRWAIRLSEYQYTCVHIKGADNVWADLIGRWKQPETLRRLVHIPVLPTTDDEEFVWPTAAEVAKVQLNHMDARPASLLQDSTDGLWRDGNGAVWIPDLAADLQLRMCVIAHTGPSGHRGFKTSLRVLRPFFTWSTDEEDMSNFVKACIHCLSTSGGGKEPRPYGPAFHGTKPNDLLQFDYVEIAPGANGEKYVLMLRDDHSDYKWFYALASTDAENAASAIIDWAAAFGVPAALMSDGPTHFKNETLRLVSKGLRVPHHFTLPYCPWSNGAVERLGKELLRTFRAVTSELKMRPEEWVDLLPMIQSVLNNAPSPQRANVPPVKAFMGMDPTSPISTFLRTATSKPVTLTKVQEERLLNMSDLQQSVENLHPLVQETLASARDRGRKASARGKLPNFAEGDFVLMAREDFTAGEKLSLRWRGPRRVVKALTEYVFQVEDLRTGLVEDAHGSRLRFYHDKTLDNEAIMPHVLASETGMPVQRLLRFEDTDDGLMVVVRWRGRSDDTLEALEKVHEDVPVLLEKLLLRKNTPAHLASKARRVLGI